MDAVIEAALLGEEECHGKNGSDPLAAMGVSMLDIIACGLGGVALLAILHMIIKIPVPPPQSESFIVVETVAKGLGELGFWVKHHDTNSQYWILPDDHPRARDRERLANPDAGLADEVNYAMSFVQVPCDGAAPFAPCPQSIAHLRISKPAIGAWEVSPLFAQYREEDRAETVMELTIHSCKVWTRDEAWLNYCSSDSPEMRLESPGRFAPGIPVPIKGP